MDYERMHTTQSPEYRQYLKSLARMASHWVPKIRLQYAEKAYEMYQDPTVRKIISAYQAEIDKLDDDLYRGFLNASEYPDYPDNLKLCHMETSCLNHAADYAQTIFLLFGIELSGD